MNKEGHEEKHWKWFTKWHSKLHHGVLDFQNVARFHGKRINVIKGAPGGGGGGCRAAAPNQISQNWYLKKETIL
jgi:hypothetical protein